MKNITPEPRRDSIELISILISSTIIAWILAFVNEGYFDYRWLIDSSRWFGGAIYTVLIFTIHFIFLKLIFLLIKRFKILIAIALSIVSLGLTLALTLDFS